MRQQIRGVQNWGIVSSLQFEIQTLFKIFYIINIVCTYNNNDSFLTLGLAQCSKNFGLQIRI